MFLRLDLPNIPNLEMKLRATRILRYGDSGGWRFHSAILSSYQQSLQP